MIWQGESDKVANEKLTVVMDVTFMHTLIQKYSNSWTVMRSNNQRHRNRAMYTVSSNGLSLG